jgi:hypothetical protein
VANLPTVAMTPAVLVTNLLPVSLMPVVHLYWLISPWSFEKNRYYPNFIFRGLGTMIKKKSVEKNLVTLSL